MKLYSYVVRSDTGFAPNPFWNCCTLATCKPKIRRLAAKGDWVAGTGSVGNVGNDRLIYAMKVTAVELLEDYGIDPLYVNKIPIQGKMEEKGDNIYYRDIKGDFRQRFPSVHSNPDGEDLQQKNFDLKGRNVLISKPGDYYYFGGEAPRIPTSLQCIIKKGPNHKSKFPKSIIDSFLHWIVGQESGFNAYPCHY